MRDDQGRVILFTGVATDITERKALEAAAPPGPEDGGGGPAGRGGGPRFQQSPDGHHGLWRTHAGQGPQGRSALRRPGKDPEGRRAGRGPDPAVADLSAARQIVHPQVVDLNRVVLDLEPMLRRLIGEDLDLEVVTDRRLGAVKADPDQLGQIIMNLVVNARDAMPQGGRLTLKTAPVELDEEAVTADSD